MYYSHYSYNTPGFTAFDACVMGSDARTHARKLFRGSRFVLAVIDYRPVDHVIT